MDIQNYGSVLLKDLQTPTLSSLKHVLVFSYLVKDSQTPNPRPTPPQLFACPEKNFPDVSNHSEQKKFFLVENFLDLENFSKFFSKIFFPDKFFFSYRKSKNKAILFPEIFRKNQ